MTARAPLARLALAGCSHGTSGDPSGPGVPPAAFTTTTPAPGLPGGTAPTAGSTADGQPPVGTSGRPQAPAHPRLLLEGVQPDAPPGAAGGEGPRPRGRRSQGGGAVPVRARLVMRPGVSAARTAP